MAIFGTVKKIDSEGFEATKVCEDALSWSRTIMDLNNKKIDGFKYVAKNMRQEPNGQMSVTFDMVRYRKTKDGEEIDE